MLDPNELLNPNGLLDPNRLLDPNELLNSNGLLHPNRLLDPNELIDPNGLLDPQNESTTIIRNPCNYLTVDASSNTRSIYSAKALFLFVQRDTLLPFRILNRLKL
jgi:hypothetical protein